MNICINTEYSVFKKKGVFFFTKISVFQWKHIVIFYAKVNYGCSGNFAAVIFC